MPTRSSIKMLFLLRGFHFQSGPLFGNKEAVDVRSVIRNIVGNDDSSKHIKKTFSQAFVDLFNSTIHLKSVFVALRGHDAFFETLAARWDAHIVGEVSTTDVRMLTDLFAKARRSHTNHKIHRWELTRLVDEWIKAVDEVARLPPLITMTVVTSGRPGNNVSCIISHLGSVSFDKSTDILSGTWPPSHFTDSDQAYLLDPKIRHRLQNISPAFFGDAGAPTLPDSRTVPSDIKFFIAYWALRTVTADKLWSICLVPVGPFWTTTDRVHWKLATGNCARTLATWDRFIQRASIAFDRGNTSVVGLLAPWLGSAEQVMSAANASSIGDSQTLVWTQKCPRQGLVVILRKVTINDQQGMEYILYDPTMMCPRLRAMPWVKGALSTLYAYRQRLKDEIHKSYRGAIIRGWVGGQLSDLEGEPNSVEMSAAFIRSSKDGRNEKYTNVIVENQMYHMEDSILQRYDEWGDCFASIHDDKPPSRSGSAVDFMAQKGLSSSRRASLLYCTWLNKYATIIDFE